MKNMIMILFTMLMFSGCVTSSLKLGKDEKLILKYSSSDIILTNKVIQSKFLNFKDLFVTIYKLQNEQNRILFYEEAQTETNFEFQYGGLYTVMYIFDNRVKYEEVYGRNNLRLVQLRLKDKSYLNIMIQASDTQNYSFTYGFSNEEFMKIAKKIKVKEDDKLLKLEREGVVFTNESEALSNWNDTLVFFTPLITPLRGVYGR
ncbi:hypothetical protein [Sulfurimonas sp.]|uniref:hypothetical protein n=1 Tax=Sulfurimonas sp. TaxID=2022749 RepID=UPI002AB1C3CA|nr:hypothetical protein [Sulfurimonas sp.]